MLAGWKNGGNNLDNFGKHLTIGDNRSKILGTGD
jgi:hypothetical protein